MPDERHGVVRAAAGGAVRRTAANGHAIAGHDLDSEAAHAAAQLGEHFVPRVALHPVQPSRVNGDHGPLHVYQIVFAQ